MRMAASYTFSLYSKVYRDEYLTDQPCPDLAMRLWPAAAAAGIAIIGSGHVNDYINGLSAYVDHEKLSSTPLVNGSVNLLACLLAFALIAYAFMPKKPKTYVLDFSVFAPPAR